MIYFVKVGNFVKIGSTNNVERRFTCLKWMVPSEYYGTDGVAPLNLLLTRPGDERVERQLHRRFARQRVRMTGEYFRLEGKLLKYLKRHMNIPLYFLHCPAADGPFCYLSKKDEVIPRLPVHSERWHAMQIRIALNKVRRECPELLSLI